jgi:FAD/FMN-containing dehydrogenase
MGAAILCVPCFAAKVVTMSGEVLHVNATSHPDLFWALRGGGANYAIVTNWEFAVVPAPSNITYASLWWEPTAANLAAVLKAFTAWRPWLLQEEVARVHIGMCEYCQCVLHARAYLWKHATCWLLALRKLLYYSASTVLVLHAFVHLW